MTYLHYTRGKGSQLHRRRAAILRRTLRTRDGRPNQKVSGVDYPEWRKNQHPLIRTDEDTSEVFGLRGQ